MNPENSIHMRKSVVAITVERADVFPDNFFVRRDFKEPSR